MRVICTDSTGTQAWIDDPSWELPGTHLPELFNGDYAFVQSVYGDDGNVIRGTGNPSPACGFNRAGGHDGGGFAGTLNQQTEMVFCCHQDHNCGSPLYIE